MVLRLPPEVESTLERVARRRETDSRVVVASGCFDLLHMGHVLHLRAARDLGDMLVVLVSDDASVRRMKGPGRPIIPADQRAEVLRALRAVDEVVVHEQKHLAAILERLAPCVFTKGPEYDTSRARRIERIVGEVRLLGDKMDVSTTEIIRRCAAAFGSRRGYVPEA